jgi:hypothetical protein
LPAAITYLICMKVFASAFRASRSHPYLAAAMKHNQASRMAMAVAPRPNNPIPAIIPPNGNIRMAPAEHPVRDHANEPRRLPRCRRVMCSPASMPRPNPAAVTAAAISVAANEGGTGGRGMVESNATSQTAKARVPPMTEPNNRASKSRISDLAPRQVSRLAFAIRRVLPT